MNLQQCLKILELENPGTIEDAKKAYRDLVRVWHPDRFQRNPRLKQKAEKKLGEINLAFNYLREYLEPDPARKPAPSTGTGRQSVSATGSTNHAARRTRHSTPANPNSHRTKPGGSVAYAGIITRRRPAFGRFILIALFIIAVFISALVVYFITSTGDITSKARGIASETVENILHKIEQDGNIQKDKSATRNFIQNKKNDSRMTQFEIHLDSSSIIMTDMWWEEGEMIMYRVDGGTMGIERSRVKKIIKR